MAVKEPDEIVIAENRVTIGAKIASCITPGVAVKKKILAGTSIVLMVFSLIVSVPAMANSKNNPASTWELIQQSLRKQFEPDSNTIETEAENNIADITVDDLLAEEQARS